MQIILFTVAHEDSEAKNQIDQSQQTWPADQYFEYFIFLKRWDLKRKLSGKGKKRGAAAAKKKFSFLFCFLNHINVF